MNCNFLGFFLDDPKTSDNKILGFNVQELNSLINNQNCLLILTKAFPVDTINYLEANNVIETLNLMDYVILG
jgi:hypothetical protein